MRVIDKTVYLGDVPCDRGRGVRRYKMLVRIKYNSGLKPANKGKDKDQLSMTGMVGRFWRGQISEGCGWIDRHNKKEGWDSETVAKLARVWQEWHLNAFHAGCEHQDAAGVTEGRCEVCFHTYGRSWTRRDVPEDVLDWLASLPEWREK